VKQPEIYHVIVNLSLTEWSDAAADGDRSEDKIRQRIEATLAGSDMQVNRINVYRGVDVG
jgi:hypothetical protein